MTQEQKELLLKDLCARLPYGVKAYVKNWSKLDRKYYEGVYTVKSAFPSLNEVHVQSKSGSVDVLLGYSDYDIKPYLFPLSSMTEEQYNEMQTISGKDCMEHMEIEKEWRNNSPFTHLPLYQHRVIEFFHKYHFDYRGLIPMGLANDATGLNIY